MNQANRPYRATWMPMEAILSPFTYTPVLPSMRSPLMSNSARLSMIDCSSYENERHMNA